MTANLYANLHPAPTLPHETLDAAAAGDTPIHSGCTVRYHTRQGRWHDGTAWVYDAARGCWLCELTDGRRTWTEWFAAESLQLLLVSEAAEA